MALSMPCWLSRVPGRGREPFGQPLRMGPSASCHAGDRPGLFQRTRPPSSGEPAASAPLHLLTASWEAGCFPSAPGPFAVLGPWWSSMAFTSAPPCQSSRHFWFLLYSPSWPNQWISTIAAALPVRVSGALLNPPPATPFCMWRFCPPPATPPYSGRRSPTVLTSRRPKCVSIHVNAGCCHWQPDKPAPSSVPCRNPSQKGVSCLLEVGDAVWSGCEDGSVVVWARGSSPSIRTSIQSHAGRVSCLTVIGSNVRRATPLLDCQGRGSSTARWFCRGSVRGRSAPDLYVRPRGERGSNNRQRRCAAQGGIH